MQQFLSNPNNSRNIKILNDVNQKFPNHIRRNYIPDGISLNTYEQYDNRNPLNCNNLHNNGNYYYNNSHYNFQFPGNNF